MSSQPLTSPSGVRASPPPASARAAAAAASAAAAAASPRREIIRKGSSSKTVQSNTSLNPIDFISRFHFSALKRSAGFNSCGRADKDYSISFTSASKTKSPTRHRSSHSANTVKKKAHPQTRHKVNNTVNVEEKDYAFGLDIEQDDDMTLESYEEARRTLGGMSEKVIAMFADAILKDGLSFIDGIQPHLNNPQEDRNDEEHASSRAKTIDILRETLSPALDVYDTFAASLIEKGEEERRKRLELRKVVKHLESDKKEWRDKREEVVKSLTSAKKREKGLKDELKRMDDKIAMAEQQMHETQKLLDNTIDNETKGRKHQQEMSKRAITTEMRDKDKRIRDLEKLIAMRDKQLADSQNSWDVCVLCQNLLQFPQSLDLQKQLTTQRRRLSAASMHAEPDQPDDTSSVTELKDDLEGAKSRIDELESHIKLREAQLEESKKEWEIASERAISKDKDMSDLMRTIGSIQRAGEEREAKAQELQKQAESKAALLESSLVSIKAEHASLDSEMKKLQENTEHYKKELLRAEEYILELKGREKIMKSDLNMAGAQLKVEKGLRTRSEQKEKEERTERIAMAAQLMAMAQDHARMEQHLKEADEVLERKWSDKMTEQKKLYDMRGNELGESHQTIAGLEGEIQALKQALNDHENGVLVSKNQTQELSQLKGEIIAAREKLKFEEERFRSVEKKYEQTVKELEAEIEQAEAERRRLHNIIQDLRGNVRVFARIRPFLPEDNCGDDPQPCVVQKFDKEIKLRLGKDEPWQHNFAFDSVFPPSSGQDVLFREASEFIQSAMDGYNVCLFSYGQTGSGKTHTMTGSGTGQMRGIIPRSIEEVGKTKAKLEREGWQYEMQVSYLEIYNEKIRDLLRDGKFDEVKHEVKVNKDGKRYVSNITMKKIDPNDMDVVESVIRQASMCRSVASTGMNSVSSRSHAIFTLHLTAIHPEKGEALRGQLNLVDLAGSERLSRSNASGDRARETVSINKSLSALTDVFAAIGRKGGHIPYRNSKLTYLLQPCLGGEGKTLMVVNLSPTDASSQESLCSLRFASHVNKCELGKAKRSIQEYAEEGDDDTKSVSSAATSSMKGGPSRRESVSSSATSSMKRGPSRRENVTSSIPNPKRKVSSVSQPRKTPSSHRRTTSTATATTLKTRVSPRKNAPRRIDDDGRSVESNISSISVLSRDSRSTVSTIGSCSVSRSPTKRKPLQKLGTNNTLPSRNFATEKR